MSEAVILIEHGIHEVGDLLWCCDRVERVRSAVSAASVSGNSIAAWYMTSGGQKLLVIHNVASSQKEVSVSDSLEKPIALLGTASVKGGKLTLGANSSVVFEL